MMNDPRYWKDGQRDPAYINKVAALFENTMVKAKAKKLELPGEMLYLIRNG